MATGARIGWAQRRAGSEQNHHPEDDPAEIQVPGKPLAVAGFERFQPTAPRQRPEPGPGGNEAETRTGRGLNISESGWPWLSTPSRARSPLPARRCWGAARTAKNFSLSRCAGGQPTRQTLQDHPDAGAPRCPHPDQQTDRRGQGGIAVSANVDGLTYQGPDAIRVPARETAKNHRQATVARDGHAVHVRLNRGSPGAAPRSLTERARRLLGDRRAARHDSPRCVRTARQHGRRCPGTPGGHGHSPP